LDFPNEKISFLDNNFLVDEKNFEAIPSNSLVVLDDYVFDPKQQPKGDFLRVINLTLRQKNIVLFLVCHNLFYNHLYFDIFNAPHIFISYSTVGDSIMK
jgi:hypothetical protein